MKQPESHHFHNGKAARAAGKPCVITDARMTPDSRQLWYDGWNTQNALMQQPPSQEEIEQNESFLQGLKAELKASSPVPCYRYFCRYCHSLHFLDQETCPGAPMCCNWRMAYRGHATAVPGKKLKGEYSPDDV